MAASRRIPAIPEPGPGMDPKVSDVLRPLKETCEVREGLRGDVLDRFATLGDLIRLGLVSEEAVRSLDG